jgi:hypothetical protein
VLDVINALLAVPGALLALDDLTDRILGSEQLGTERRAEFERLRVRIIELRAHLERFAEFGPEMQAWKDAHHVTSLIMAECEDTFRFIDQGRASFLQLNSVKWKRIRNELSTMRKPKIGSFTYLTAHPNPAIFSHVTDPNDFMSTPRWDAYLIDLEQTCRNWLDKAQRDDLFDALRELKNFTTALNQRADQRLKDGLGELTKVIIEFRGALAEQRGDSSHAA